MSRVSLGKLFAGGVPFRSRYTYWDSGLGWRPSGLTLHRRGAVDFQGLLVEIGCFQSLALTNGL